jgi:tetrapyrrole methylase family protein/MazG family protein
MDKEKFSFYQLCALAEKLRGKNGCAWDRKQTFDSLKSAVLEEAYEVVETIQEKDDKKITEELGDLLYQIIFLAQIAKDEKRFDISGIIKSAYEKMVRRHPHVFEGKSAKDDKEIIKKWYSIKNKEKGKENRKSVLDGICKELPALLYATTVQRKAAHMGFDWKKIDDVWEKVREEIGELEAVALKDKIALEEEFGDLLFALVNLSRFMELDAEQCLRKAVKKFSGRFKKVEERVKGKNQDMNDMCLEELDAIWEEVKKEES